MQGKRNTSKGTNLQPCHAQLPRVPISHVSEAQSSLPMGGNTNSRERCSAKLPCTIELPRIRFEAFPWVPHRCTTGRGPPSSTSSNASQPTGANKQTSQILSPFRISGIAFIILQGVRWCTCLAVKGESLCCIKRPQQLMASFECLHPCCKCHARFECKFTPISPSSSLAHDPSIGSNSSP